VKYYQVKSNFDDIGVYPQCKKITQAHFNSYNNTRYANYHPSYRPKIEKAELEYQARVSDFIMGANFSFYYFIFLSEKAYDALQTLEIVPHNKLEVPLYKKAKLIGTYSLILLNLDIHEHVNYEGSTFSLFNKTTKESNVISLDPVEYYSDIGSIRLAKEYYLRPEKIVFNQEFSYDVFTSVTLGLGLIVSENVVHVIKERQLTGWSFEEMK